MRKVVYGGAMSLDGFIAGPNGEYDWIVMDPEIDFAAQIKRFDTFLIGRKTFEVMRTMAASAPPTPGIHQHRLFADAAACRLPERHSERRCRGSRGRTPCSERQRHRALWGRRAIPQPPWRGSGGRSGCRGDSGAARSRRAIPAAASGTDEASVKEAQGLRENRHRLAQYRHRPQVTGTARVRLTRCCSSRSRWPRPGFRPGGRCASIRSLRCGTNSRWLEPNSADVRPSA